MTQHLTARYLRASIRSVTGMEFSSTKEMKEYLKEHPKADKSKHRVKKNEKKGPAAEETPTGVFQNLGHALQKEKHRFLKHLKDAKFLVGLATQPLTLKVQKQDGTTELMPRSKIVAVALSSVLNIAAYPIHRLEEVATRSLKRLKEHLKNKKRASAPSMMEEHDQQQLAHQFIDILSEELDKDTEAFEKKQKGEKKQASTVTARYLEQVKDSTIDC